MPSSFLKSLAVGLAVGLVGAGSAFANPASGGASSNGGSAVAGMPAAIGSPVSADRVRAAPPRPPARPPRRPPSRS